MSPKQEDKNLRISQLHHKMKENLNGEIKTIKKIISIIAILMLGQSTIVFGSAMPDMYDDIDQKNVYQIESNYQENEKYVSGSSFAEANGYQLAWSDEFEGYSLNTTKWTASNNFADKSSNVRISNSNLILTSTKELDDKVYGANIESRNKFHFRYGYIEYKAKLTNKIGFKSSLWLNGVYNWPPEIDIIETGSSQSMYMTRHCRPDSTYPDCDGIYKYVGGKVDMYKMASWKADFDKSSAYHTYGVEWTPTYVRWIIDGIERYRVTTGVPKEDMYIYASFCARTSVRKCWPETITASEFPTSIYIDYIRVYKKAQISAGVTIVSPNGGEMLERGTTKTIKWNGSNIGSYVKIELLKSGITNNLISASTPNDGSFGWTIPSTQNPGTDYKVKITSTANNLHTDTSNSNFIITPISVIFPNGGDDWVRGTTKTIKWSYTGNPSYVKIELLKGGVLNRVISHSTPIGSYGSGSYNWYVPSTQTLGTDYKIKVTSTSNSAYTDLSNNYFKISTPSITTISPNGGESWARGSTKTISWKSVGNTGTYIKIELLKGGVFNKLIASSTPNDGTYSWYIPSIQYLGSDYKIRITSTSNSAYTDLSNNYFKIY